MVAIRLLLDPGVVRLLLGLGVGWGLGASIAAAQIGPARLRAIGRRGRTIADSSA
jgi:hypothetical protein